MTACTSPLLTVRSTPLRISLSSIETCRFSISNIGVLIERVLPPGESESLLLQTESGLGPVGQVPASRAQSRKNRVMAFDREAGALLSNMGGHERHRNFDIKNDAAIGAVDMVMALGPAVIAAGLIGERQFLDQAMFDQQMQ